jgi:DNA-binding transcriptional LysR family regulator
MPNKSAMNIFQIETFLIIVETKSISKAAEKAFLSQPTVSHRLQALEDELGFRLLDRSKGQHHVHITLKGEQFIPIAHKWMDLWQDVKQLSAAGSNYPITLGSTGAINTYILPDFFKEILRKDERAPFDLEVRSGDNDDIYALSRSREIDIGLITGGSDLPTTLPRDEGLPGKSQFSWHGPNPETIGERLSITPLFSEKLLLLKLKAAAETDRTAYHPSELDVKNELFFSCTPGYQKWHSKWWGAAGKPYAMIDSEHLISDFLNHKDMWVVVPASVAEAMAAKGQYEAYDILYPPDKRICYRLLPRNVNEDHSAGVTLFDRRLKDYLAGLNFIAVY